MSARPSRFGTLSDAVREEMTSVDARPGTDLDPPPVGAGRHKPAAKMEAVGEGLRQRVQRLEADLAAAAGRNVGLEQDLARARQALERAGGEAEMFLFLSPALVDDPLPRDRLPGAFAGLAFDALLADIRDHGQNDAITVRTAAVAGRYEVAAGRRRLEACRQLGRDVLARMRRLDDAAMLRVQFSENERRQDISALERARWFAEVRERLGGPAKDIAAQFGLDQSTLSLYLRLARFPAPVLERLHDPRLLSVLRARRVMEVLDADDQALPRILATLAAEPTPAAGDGEPERAARQIERLMQAVDGRGDALVMARTPHGDRRHVVHDGRRIGTLTRNGRHWVFRFASSLRDDTVRNFTDRVGPLLAEIEAEAAAAPRG